MFADQTHTADSSAERTDLVQGGSMVGRFVRVTIVESPPGQPAAWRNWNFLEHRRHHDSRSPNCHRHLKHGLSLPIPHGSSKEKSLRGSYHYPSTSRELPAFSSRSRRASGMARFERSLIFRSGPMILAPSILPGTHSAPTLMESGMMPMRCSRRSIGCRRPRAPASC